MKSKNLKEMEQLMELKFQKKQQVFLQAVAEEGRLRSMIKKLDDQAQDAEKSNAYQLRAIGADVVWNSWVERSKRGLNLELAQILAQKDRLKNTVRKEYGKVLVTRELKQMQSLNERHDLQRRKLEAAIDSYFQQRTVSASK